MMSAKYSDLLYVVIGLLIAIGGYIAFRTMYFASETLPFAQEMVLVFLGAVATIYLTASLLNRQTQLELRKEGQLIVLQQKSDIYMFCIDKVVEIVEAGRHDPHKIEQLKVLSHKLAVYGSPDVVRLFSDVIDALINGFGNACLSDAEGKKVMVALAEMTGGMRQDMLKEIGTYKEADPVKAIRRNSRRMEVLDDLDHTQSKDRSHKDD